MFSVLDIDYAFRHHENQIRVAERNAAARAAVQARRDRTEAARRFVDAFRRSADDLVPSGRPGRASHRVNPDPQTCC
jgi:hypothetical protein